jgi:hypothetical protein
VNHRAHKLAQDLHDLEQILIEAHRNLDWLDLYREITRYPKPFNLEDNNGNQSDT